MKSVCRIIVWGFGLLYAGALVLLLIGTYGLFGAETDPLSGVFLLPLGLPWNLLLDGAPDHLLPWVGIVAPAVNLGILMLLCRGRRKRRT